MKFTYQRKMLMKHQKIEILIKGVSHKLWGTKLPIKMLEVGIRLRIYQGKEGSDINLAKIR